MQIHNAIITGSFSYNGADLSNVTSSNAYSASLSSRTTNLESTSSVLVGASSSFSSILTSVSSSQQQISASLLQVSASYIALSGSYIALSASYNTFSGSASIRVSQIEQVYATTGSNSFRATQSITGSLTVTGQIIAQTINVQQVTSSIIYSSGSNVFGCDINSRQTFTGSFYQTGSTAYFAGNVGINTLTPTNGRLEIQQSSCVPGLWIQTGGTTSAFCIASFRTGTNLPALEIYGNGNLYFGGTSCFQSGVCINHTVKPQLTINGNTGAGAALSFRTQLTNSTCNRNWALVTEDNTAGDFAFKVSCLQYCDPVSYGFTAVQLNRCGWMTIGSTVEEALLTSDALGKNITAIRLKADCGAVALSVAGTGEVRVDYPGVGGGRLIIKDNGVATFGYQICAPYIALDNSANANTNAINIKGYSSTVRTHIGTFSNNSYYSNNWYYDGGQTKDCSTYGSATVNLNTGPTATDNFINFNVDCASSSTPTERMRIANDGYVGINCSCLGSRTFVVRSINGRAITAEFIEQAGQHSLYIQPNKNSTNHISSDYVSSNVYLPLSLSGRECTTDFLLGTNGRVGIGSGANKGILTVYESGCTVDRGIPAFDTQAKGIEIYNANSGTTNNVVGLWISTGPHKVGIASGRTCAETTWEVDLRFYTHPTTVGSLDSTCENMRLYGDGSLVTRGATSTPGLYSDINLKENLLIIPSALNKIKCINGYLFDWKYNAPARSTPDLLNIIHDAGLIAQEVEEVMPDIVRNNDLSCIKMLNYNGITALLVEGMKEQQCTINTLKTCLGIN